MHFKFLHGKTGKGKKEYKVLLSLHFNFISNKVKDQELNGKVISLVILENGMTPRKGFHKFDMRGHS